MIGSNFLGYDIMSPNFLLKQTNNQINKTIVFIVHNDNKTKKILSNQLLRYNIIKKNIIKLEFFKNLRDVR